jgi:hypothetical protein
VLFDACFMGCVEVAWALRGTANLVGFSPTEIMSDGFDYGTLAERLIGSDEPDALGVCEDYFAQYSAAGQSTPYATITLVDTRKMAPLASLCKTLFEKYRLAINSLTSWDVQRYYRSGHNSLHEHLFDLRDMLVKAGITDEETDAFDEALDACILYERHTPKFISLPLVNVCGLSVLLPSSASWDLKEYYKEHVAWNTETQLLD